MGLSLHAATQAGAHDLRGREALVKSMLRPPIAEEHLRLLPDDLVRIQLKRPFRDGTYAVDMDPLSRLCRLAASLPPPRQHLRKLAPLAALRFAQGPTRYAGVLAAASKGRALVVPPPPSRAAEPAEPPSLNPITSPVLRPTHRCRYRPWAELLRRTFAIDVDTCERCGARMKLLALVRDPEGIARYLHHLGEPTEPPPLSPARAPPYWKSRVLRRRPADQGELGGA